MSLTDELQRLVELKAAGSLTEKEFEQAKAKLLEEESPARFHEPDDRHDQSLGRAANRYVTFQFVMAIIMVMIFLLIIAPKMCSGPRSSFVPSIGFRSR